MQCTSSPQSPGFSIDLDMHIGSDIFTCIYIWEHTWLWRSTPMHTVIFAALWFTNYGVRIMQDLQGIFGTSYLSASVWNTKGFYGREKQFNCTLSCTRWFLVVVSLNKSEPQSSVFMTSFEKACLRQLKKRSWKEFYELQMTVQKELLPVMSNSRNQSSAEESK